MSTMRDNAEKFEEFKKNLHFKLFSTLAELQAMKEVYKKENINLLLDLQTRLSVYYDMYSDLDLSDEISDYWEEIENNIDFE